MSALRTMSGRMFNLEKSRFNPKPGLMDFWTEFKKPNPYRWPILAISTIPFAIIFWWLSGETAYVTPEKPRITYITTLDENRSDEEIIASNKANQELKELREAEEERMAQRKRDMYKALGAAAGMDVDAIEERADAERARAKAEREEELDEIFGDEDSDSASNEGGTP